MIGVICTLTIGSSRMVIMGMGDDIGGVIQVCGVRTL